jgi:hypothetical protein
MSRSGAMAAMAVFGLLAGCASQAPRERLRQCNWELASIRMDEQTSAKLRGTARMRVRNPTSGTAVLDSLWVDVSTPGGALGRLSHGGSFSLPAGATDSVDIHVEAVPAQLSARMMEMLFGAPDSLSLNGEIRLPVMGGLFHAQHAFHARIPAQAVNGALGQFLRGDAGEGGVPDDSLPEDEDGTDSLDQQE